MKNISIFLVMLLLIFALFSIPVKAFVQRIGIPRLDGIDAETETDPNIQLALFLAGEFDYFPDIMRSSDRAVLETAGHQLVGTSGFHVSEIEINCRDYVPADAGQPDAGRSLWPLNDTNFRLAMAWSGLSIAQKESSIVDIHGPDIATPAYSKIPPALGFWHNPTVTKPGGNYTKAWEILLAAGYFVSEGMLYGPNHIAVRDIDVLSPSELPLEVEFCQRFVDQWNDFFDNYVEVVNCDFYNVPISFNYLIVRAFLYRNFDVCWMSHHVGRFPDFLYDMFHSTQDFPWGRNKCGIKDNELDGYLETTKHGLSLAEIEIAVWDAQERLYELSPIINVYHRIYLEAIRGTDPEALENYVSQLGTGTDNDWSWWLMHWANSNTGGKVNYILGPYIDNLHPGWVDSESEEWVLDRIHDGLTAITSDLIDIPWIALEWNAETFSWAPLGIDEGTKINFRFRNDLYWNDGFPLAAEDIKFAWEFMRNFPKFFSAFEYLLWVEIHDPQTITAYLDTTSQFIIYDFARIATLFPEHIYNPEKHPTRDTVNDPVWEINWNDWMADYTGVMPGTAGYLGSALVFNGAYDLADVNYSNEWLNLTAATRVSDFFSDSPIEIAVNVAGRVGSMVGGTYNGNFEYAVTIVNAGSKDNVTGELVACEIGPFVVYIDDVVENMEIVDYSLDPFDYVEFGPYIENLTPGPHNFKVEVYERGVSDPIDVTTQFIIATPREDPNYDFWIGIDDIVRAAEAFGSQPPPFPGNARWDSKVDLNDDYYIGIDDIVDIAEDFGGPW